MERGRHRGKPRKRKSWRYKIKEWTGQSLTSLHATHRRRQKHVGCHPHKRKAYLQECSGVLEPTPACNLISELAIVGLNLFARFTNFFSSRPYF